MFKGVVYLFVLFGSNESGMWNLIVYGNCMFDDLVRDLGFGSDVKVVSFDIQNGFEDIYICVIDFYDASVGECIFILGF